MRYTANVFLKHPVELNAQNQPFLIVVIANYTSQESDHLEDVNLME